MRAISAQCVAVVAICLAAPVSAQVVHDGWSQLEQLSTSSAEVRGDMTMVVGEKGLHLFWVEREADIDAVMYSRFAERTWQTPVDLFVARAGARIGDISAYLHQDRLRLAWVMEPNGPVYSASAPESDAASLQSWEDSVSAEVQALRVEMAADDGGLAHLVYTNVYGASPGVYYRRSPDGIRWGRSLRLDQMPEGHRPFNLRLALDRLGGLHAVWAEVEQTSGTYRGRYVVYARSRDGGETWDAPTRIDSAVEPKDRIAHPSIATRDEEVHVIWQTADLGRQHKFSRDRGKTWEPGGLEVGDLHGQARGDALIVDKVGRLHFLSQIRWPMAIFEFVRDDGEWSPPSKIYQIAETYQDPVGSRIEAHYVRAAISPDGRIVLLFQDAPNVPQQRLFAIHTESAGY